VAAKLKATVVQLEIVETDSLFLQGTTPPRLDDRGSGFSSYSETQPGCVSKV
jgi:hypothetical protein